MANQLVDDALAISESWRGELDMTSLVARQLERARVDDLDLDVVAIGKSSREMARALDEIRGTRVRRRFIVAVRGSEPVLDGENTVMIGEHPIAGAGSRAAGLALRRFFDEESTAQATIFLLSGGASSLCVLPEEPLTLDDLRGLWDAVLRVGADITTLNKLRGATSLIGGGEVLRYVRTPRSCSVIMVDNVVSGAPWVASGLTYDYAPSLDEMISLLDEVQLTATPLGRRLRTAFQQRAAKRTRQSSVTHENLVMAEPSLVLAAASDDARSRGYRVVEVGRLLHGDVSRLAAQWREALYREMAAGDHVALVGVGEATVKVRGPGRGGRCQEFAWSMVDVLASAERDAVFVARATDGRDFLEGVAGAWVRRSTASDARQRGINVADVLEANDTYSALAALGQIIKGVPTGWNLCDLYLTLV